MKTRTGNGYIALNDLSRRSAYCFIDTCSIFGSVGGDSKDRGMEHKILASQTELDNIKAIREDFDAGGNWYVTQGVFEELEPRGYRKYKKAMKKRRTFDYHGDFAKKSLMLTRVRREKNTEIRRIRREFVLKSHIYTFEEKENEELEQLSDIYRLMKKNGKGISQVDLDLILSALLVSKFNNTPVSLVTDDKAIFRCYKQLRRHRHFSDAFVDFYDRLNKETFRKLSN